MRSRIPVLAGIDPLDSVTTIDNLVESTEQTGRIVMRAGNCSSEAARIGPMRSGLAFPENR